MNYVKSGLSRGWVPSVDVWTGTQWVTQRQPIISWPSFESMLRPMSLSTSLSSASSITLQILSMNWVPILPTPLGQSIGHELPISHCHSSHYALLTIFSWDLRRDRASNYLRSIEIGANVKMNYVVVVVWWYTGSWIIWSVSWSMTRMAFFFQSLHCVWISSIDWCMVSVLGARSREQSPQPTLTSVCL